MSHEEMHSQVEYIVAHGIVSEVNGQRVIIGSAHFVFEDEHCAIPEGNRSGTIPCRISIPICIWPSAACCPLWSVSLILCGQRRKM